MYCWSAEVWWDPGCAIRVPILSHVRCTCQNFPIKISQACSLCSERQMVANRHLQFFNGSEHFMLRDKKTRLDSSYLGQWFRVEKRSFWCEMRQPEPGEHPFFRKKSQKAKVGCWHQDIACGYTSPPVRHPPCAINHGRRQATKLVSTVEGHEEREERREVFSWAPGSAMGCQLHLLNATQEQDHRNDVCIKM